VGLLGENEAKRLDLPLPLLICFAMFAAWQMGMVYFSGQTMSADGRTPLPVEVGNLTAIIAAGYILSILVMIFLPGIIVWAERILAGTALLSVLALYLPLPPETLALALYAQYFCCCFMIGFETAVIVALFKEKTALLHLTAAYGVSMALVAALHNDFYPPVLFGFPAPYGGGAHPYADIFLPPPRRVLAPEREKNRRPPGALAAFCGGSFLGRDDLLCDSVRHCRGGGHGPRGVCVLPVQRGGGFSGIPALEGLGSFALSERYRHGRPGAMGFVLAIASLYIKGLSLAACILLGAGSVPLSLNPFFGAVLFAKRYPSRFIAPGIIGVAFLTVLLHTALLEMFRDLIAVRYAAYAVIAVCAVILFLILEPYLMYAFRGKSAFLEALEGRGFEEETGKGRDRRAKRGRWRKRLLKT
jgi:hypothetical protein